ncbi:MAG: carbamoyltransferase HypF [Gammaproteobacteria bacterium]
MDGTTGDRLHIVVHGAVQGVGFRPHVCRLARALALDGWVRNRADTVEIEAQGAAAGELLARLQAAPPAHARIERIECGALPRRAARGFHIAPSVAVDVPVPRVPPDLAPCPACLAEVDDPASRFHRYPFTNCSACGPRYSIVDALPYDRARTAMAGFALCPTCQADYDDDAGRRYHAQPTTCPACGPRLAFAHAHDRESATGTAALAAAIACLRGGGIVAVKGVGGYQLVADATRADVVQHLRARKRRPHKPLALLVAGVTEAHALCAVSAAEAALLTSAAAPIVLLARRADANLPAAVAPGLGTLGVMLPASPLHHLLAQGCQRPLVCTSGNRAEEPIAIDVDEAHARLADIAEAWLDHDRPIRRALDDSVMRVIDGAPQCLRAGRGLAPVVLEAPAGEAVLACGGQLKNTVAVAADRRVIVGQHLGDLDDALTLDAMHDAAADLVRFHAVAPRLAAVDLHPDYAGDADGPGGALPRRRVQHHLAHALAVMLEHRLDGPLLAVAWDGNGLGADGHLWGGEFLEVRRAPRPAWRRLAHLRDFALPGGDAAARDPRRALAGVQWEIPALRARVPDEFRLLLERGLNAPRTTSAGRLFDAVAALLGFDAVQSYEGQAACQLEHCAVDDPLAAYPMPCVDGVLDWQPMIEALVADAGHAVAVARSSARFHATLVAAIVDRAAAAGHVDIVLCGGCFQNRRLSESAAAALRAAGHRVHLARRLPPHDGALAAGQATAVIDGFVN